MSKTSKQNSIAWILAAGLVLSMLYHYWNEASRGLGFPWNTFLFMPGARFTDFYDQIPALASRNPYLGVPAVYFPFWFVLGLPLTWFNPDLGLKLFIAVFFIFWAPFAAYWLWNSERKLLSNIITVLIYVLCPLPVLFALDRGNSELLVFLLIGTWVIAEDFAQKAKMAGRKSVVFYQALAVGSLAAATAFKGYPGLYLLTYLPGRRIKEAASVVVSAAALTFGSLLWLGGPILSRIAKWRHDLEHYRFGYVIDQAGLAYNVSLLGFEKLFFGVVLGMAGADDPKLMNIANRLVPWNTAITLIGLVLLAVWYWRAQPHHFKRWQLLLLPTIAFLTLSEVSAIYKMLHLLFPLLIYSASDEHDRKDPIYVALFGLALIPKDYGYLLMHPMYPASIASLLDPLILLALAWSVLMSTRSKMEKDYT